MDSNVFSMISEAFRTGGIWMWAITGVQIVAMAIIAERFFQLFVLRAPNQRKVVRDFENELRTGKLDRALQAKAPMGRSQPIYSVIQTSALVASQMGGREEIQSKVEEILVNEDEKLSKRTGYLAVLANVSTLLGLLGTIIGLIESFSSVVNLNAAEKAKILTQGISLAMNTTAYGLIVAIPTLVVYALLQSRSSAISDDLYQASLKIYNWLGFGFESIPKKKIGRG